MQLYRVTVRLAGDMRNTVEPSDRGFGHGIVSWPEIQVLRAIHGGEDTVVLTEDAGQAPDKTTGRAEKSRLLQVGYAAGILERLYPGSSPRMDLDPPLDEPGLPVPSQPLPPPPPPAKGKAKAEPEPEPFAEVEDEPTLPTKKGKATPPAN